MNNYKNIKVQVACLPNCEKQIKGMFLNILADYSKRFNAPVTTEKFQISICLVEYDEESNSEGLTIRVETENKILIQLRDPFMNDWEGNPYMVSRFVGILCHEMVHACQHLTGRKGFKIPKITYDKASEQECYYFDPMEVEARVFESPYAELYGKVLYE
jgi:hypothetical protein